MSAASTCGVPSAPPLRRDAAPRPGSMAWMRAWHGDLIKRGNQVSARGRRAVVLSTRGGLVYVQEFSTGQRVGVRPHEIGPS